MKNCPKCNAVLEDSAMFCTSCGNKLAAPAPAPAAPAQGQYTPPAAPAQAPQAQYTYQPPQAAPQQPQQNQYAYQPPQAAPQAPYAAPAPAPVADEFDHTADFDAADISEHKVYCMLVYLMGIAGILVALLACQNSPYTKFHVSQALKFCVCEALLMIVTGVLAFTFIVPIAALIMICVLFVLQIICFFQICKGQAKEPAIIRNLKFLK